MLLLCCWFLYLAALATNSINTYLLTYLLIVVKRDCRAVAEICTLLSVLLVSDVFIAHQYDARYIDMTFLSVCPSVPGF